ncbi:nuclear transport factor 2 family protein [uncultured Roseovarius sp.]|uniref:nuclear transport factor 2 family protein n=1 Tax=uncultured Roseovarius sp. TaxID=293344 RepID=UPI002614108D|nr:nuclear transport factor 2 family protein [uncultured Roseovarius sp.]
MNRADDIAAVKAVIGEYVLGTQDRDVSRLSAIFHPKAVMSGYRGSTPLIGSPQPFFDLLEANEHGEGYEAEISHVSIVGRTACARLVEENLYGKSFVNDFHLLLANGSWLIVSKLFHRD